jgi:predicted MFS family arabinose efflux permease
MRGAVVGTEFAAESARHLAVRIAALGVAQIISWGTLFYTIAVLGAAMRADLGVSDTLLFGAFSAGLLVSGAASPAVGRWIDAGHARSALSGGSCVGALALAILAFAQGPVTLFAGWIVAGAAMALTLYDPAFAVLHTISGTGYRKAVTALTLFGGFASTVFWPLSLMLQDAFGWRTAFVVFAAMHAVVCLPLHFAVIPGSARSPSARAATQKPVPAKRAPDAGDPRFAWLALALSGASFIASALSAHAIGLLTATGLTAADAVLVGALFGPMQVAGRVVEFTVGTRLNAHAVGTVAFVLLAVALAFLSQVKGALVTALAFALFYGFSNGVMTIVRGTVPAEIFGRHAFGTLLGRLARPQLIARAVAPVALAACFAFDPARTITPYLLVLLGAAAFVAYRKALRSR